MSDIRSSNDNTSVRELFLRVHDSGGQVQEYRVANGLTIGRSSSNHVVLADDAAVDPTHARVLYQPDGAVWLYPVGLSNEISVNGRPVRELRLSPGVKFRIGYNAFFECVATASAGLAAEGEAVEVEQAGDAEVPRIAMVLAGLLLGAGAGAGAGVFLAIPVLPAAGVGAGVGALIGAISRKSPAH